MQTNASVKNHNTDSASHLENTRPANDVGQVSDITVLVGRAAEGDRRAIGAIALALGPDLLAVARSAVRHREDAADVLQDFFALLLTGEAARFPPAPGCGLEWMEGLLLRMGRMSHEQRAAEWGLSDPDHFHQARRFRRRRTRR